MSIYVSLKGVTRPRGLRIHQCWVPCRRSKCSTTYIRDECLRYKGLGDTSPLLSVIATVEEEGWIERWGPRWLTQYSHGPVIESLVRVSPGVQMVLDTLPKDAIRYPHAKSHTSHHTSSLNADPRALLHVSNQIGAALREKPS